MKLNNKGFSLIEVLAVVVILGVLATIMIPMAGRMLQNNREDNYKNIKKSILVAARDYMSDHRYDITLSGVCELDDDGNNIGSRTVQFINENEINGKLLVSYLINDKYINGKITNPLTGKELDETTSYVFVEYDCVTRNYVYGKCFDGDDGCSDTKKNVLIWK
ncbi:MAG: type II secretion system protein [Bacilli bacterium]|nr:type II secretion system protein [Bacilli bacterium]